MAGCDCNKYAEWEFTGFTRKMRMAYWDAIQKHVLAEYEMQAAVHGIDIRKDAVSGGKFNKEEAEAYIKNPLKDFPNDVDYSVFKEDALMQKAKEYAAFHAANPHPLTFEESKIYWTPERIIALHGNEPVAKRASVKGELWALYLEMKKHKSDVALEDLRVVLANDFAFLRLLPSESEMMEYNKGRDPDKLYSLFGTVTVIPDKHVQKLFDANAFPKELMRYVRI